MALNLSKLMKQKVPPTAAGTGLPPDMASMMGAQSAPAPGLTAPPAPGMGALMAPAAPKRKAKPKRKGGKGY